MSDEPPCCSFCFNHDIPLFEGGVLDSTTRICAFCATRALAEITPQPVPEPAPPPERPSKEALLASIPSPKTLVAHLDQHVIGQSIAKRRLALGVSNHFKRLVDAWEGKYSVNPWLRVVTRLSLFGCDEPSPTEPR